MALAGASIPAIRMGLFSCDPSAQGPVRVCVTRVDRISNTRDVGSRAADSTRSQDFASRGQMADRCRRCGCRFSFPGTDGRKEAANQESAADLEGQPMVARGLGSALCSILRLMSDAGGADIGGVVGVPISGRR
jgi:hypothetical protein